MASDDNISLQQQLADILPKDSRFRFYHVSTPPIKCDALLAALPHGKPERTYCESHLLSASITSANSSREDELLVVAIEIQIYTTKDLTTIFVSKADSTGFLSILGLPKSRSSPLRDITSTFVAHLAKTRQRPTKRLVLSLFARAQDQYLFPGSVDNDLKHVLDDRGLIKWWCRVLDPVLRSYEPEKELTVQELEAGKEVEDKATAKGYLVIPGIEKYETRTYFPATTSGQWTHGDPLRRISPDPNAPPRSLIPHFPDDPKSRFLDELDAELPERNAQTLTTPTRSDGQWKTVKTLEQFWEFMSFRQECSSGRLVGFIWVVITPPDFSASDGGVLLPDSQSSQSSILSSSPPKSQSLQTLHNLRRPARSSPRRSSKPKPTRKLTGPIVPKPPRIKCASSTSSESSQSESTPHYSWPPAGRGTLVLNEKDYKRALEVLLHQNFSDRVAGARSTEEWIAQIGSLIGDKRKWGWSVVGKREEKPANIIDEALGGANGVNVMNVMSVKRKATDPALLPAGAGGVNTLGVRKKPKVESDQAPGVNVLSAGLVKTKPKAS